MPRRDGTTSRRHVSVKGKTFAALSAKAMERATSVSGILEALIAEFFDGEARRTNPKRPHAQHVMRQKMADAVKLSKAKADAAGRR